MRYSAALCALAMAIGSTPPSWAGTTQLKLTGKVSSVAALQDQTPTTTPSGSIHAGDAITLSATFDRSKAELGSLFDADPTVNIYNLPGTTVTLSIGSYSRTWSPSSFNSTVQLWNDRVVTPGQGGVDSQSFSFFDYNVQPTSLIPFDLGTGQQSALASLNMFDFTGTARTNDLISQFAPASAFGSKSFSYGLLNADSKLFVHVAGDVSDVTLTDLAVPTPDLNLIGARVTASLLYPGMNLYSGGGSAIVGDGVEFLPGFFTRAGDAAPQSIDVGANSISLFTNAAATYSTSDFNGFRLDFSNYAGSLDSLGIAPTSTFRPTDFRVDGNSVYINVSGKTVRANDVLVLAAVPEPATWAMLVVGFGAIGGAVRRRKGAPLALA